MSISAEEDLDNMIICPKCHTLHKKIRLEEGYTATCNSCGVILYRYEERMLVHSLAFSITGLILFLVANLFPLVSVDMLGIENHVSILSMISALINKDFLIVGIVVSFLIFIFPFMLLLSFIALTSLMLLGIGREISKDLLVLISKILPWSMLEIYLVSILVALVKLMGLMQIHFGLSFWALVLFVMLDIYLSKSIRVGEYWELRRRIYYE
jgi:paraquat-inducible protein A